MTGGLKTLVMGFGHIADTLGDDAVNRAAYACHTHALALCDHPAFSWVAVCDPRPEARRRAADIWGVPQVAASLDDLTSRDEIEVAVLASPPGERLAVMAALPNLKAVLVEKPLGLDLAEAERFAAQCRSRGILAQVNLYRRGDAQMRELAAGGLERLVGRVQGAFGLYGNGLHNNGSHLVDLVRQLLGPVEAVLTLGAGRSQPVLPLAGDVQTAFALRLAGGAMVTVQAIDFTCYREVGLDIWGERGRLSVMQEGLSVQYYPLAASRQLDGRDEIASDRPQPLPVTISACFRPLYDNLAAAVTEREALVSPVASALVTERVVEAIRLPPSGGGWRAVEQQ